MKVETYKPNIENKGWGYEEVICNCEDYCGKILWFNPNSKISLHQHRNKKEHFRVLGGSFIFNYIDTSNATRHSLNLKVGDIIYIPPMLPHQLISDRYEGGSIIEFSTTHFDDDSYRIEPGDSQKKTDTEKSAAAVILGESYEK